MRLPEMFIPRFSSRQSLAKDDQAKQLDTVIDIASGVPEIEKQKPDGTTLLSVNMGEKIYPRSGYMNSEYSTNAWKIISKAIEEETPIIVRVERKRTTEGDVRPMAEVMDRSNDPNRNLVKIITGVYNHSKREWVPTSDVLSNPDEDPQEVKDKLEEIIYMATKRAQSEIKEEDLEAMFNADFSDSTAPLPQGPTDSEAKNKALVSIFTSIDKGKELSTKEKSNIAKILLKVAKEIQEEKLEDSSGYTSNNFESVVRLVTYFGLEVVNLPENLTNESASKWMDTVKELSSEAAAMLFA